MTEPVIEAHAVVKRFGKVEALSGLDLVAHAGEVTAVLGPNGAGKTTFVPRSPHWSARTRAACGWPASTPCATPAGLGG